MFGVIRVHTKSGHQIQEHFQGDAQHFDPKIVQSEQTGKRRVGGYAERGRFKNTQENTVTFKNIREYSNTKSKFKSIHGFR